jgi:group I intron endonuclease
MGRGIIYLITNKENGHKYIGQTTQPMNKQWQMHIQEANRMSSQPLHRAFREYGVHRFSIQEIDECNENLLNEKEQYWIEQYKPEYNPIIKPIPIPEVVKIVEPTPQRDRSQQKSWGSLTDKNRGDGKHSGLKIRSKNLVTGICTDYENARIAAKEITGDPGRNANILLAARTGGTAYGHRWQIMEDKSKKKPIFGVNKKTELIEVRYESIAAAIRELKGEGKGTTIIKSLRNPGRYSWRGYFWFYG